MKLLPDSLDSMIRMVPSLQSDIRNDTQFPADDIISRRQTDIIPRILFSYFSVTSKSSEPSSSSSFHSSTLKFYTVLLRSLISIIMREGRAWDDISAQALMEFQDEMNAMKATIRIVIKY